MNKMRAVAIGFLAMSSGLLIGSGNGSSWLHILNAVFIVINLITIED